MAWGIIIGVVVLFLLLVLPSIRRIGPTQVGLIQKRFGFKKLSNDNPVAFKGEPGYQAELLMPGLRWTFWIPNKVERFPWIHAGGRDRRRHSAGWRCRAHRCQVGGLQESCLLYTSPSPRD